VGAAVLLCALNGLMLWSESPREFNRRGRLAAARQSLLAWASSACAIALAAGWFQLALQAPRALAALRDHSGAVVGALAGTAAALGTALLGTLGYLSGGAGVAALCVLASSAALAWAALQLGSFAVLACALLLPAPIALGALAACLYGIRLREFDEPEVEPSEDLSHLGVVRAHEDLCAQNHLATLSPIRPGALRLFMLRAALRAVALLAWLRFNRGHAGGVRTIHFLRFAVLPERRQLLFLSNYDGPFGAYMSDFSIARPLNAVWSNTLGFPRAFFLLGAGGRDEARFKAIARAHQLPTLAWWSANPGLSARDIHETAAFCADLLRPRRWQSPLAARFQWLFGRPMSEADCDRSLRRVQGLG
jgi:hypothetical protein